VIMIGRGTGFGVALLQWASSGQAQMTDDGQHCTFQRVLPCLEERAQSCWRSRLSLLRNAGEGKKEKNPPLPFDAARRRCR